MDQELERKLSAIRLGEMLEPYSSRASTMSSYYQNHQGVPRKAPETSFDSPSKTENLYANLQELQQSHYYETRTNTSVLPRSHLTSVTQTQSTTQTKMSLQEAMRYTPPDMAPNTSNEPPVYENIQYYSPQVNKLQATTFTHHENQLYKPIPSTATSASKSNVQTHMNSPHSVEQFVVPAATKPQQTYMNINSIPSPYKPVPATQKTFEVSYLQNSTKEIAGYMPPATSASYVNQPSLNHAKQNVRVSAAHSVPQYSAQSLSQQPKTINTSSPLSNRSSLPSQESNLSPSTSQYTSGSSSPKVPMATIPAKKVKEVPCQIF